MEDGNGVLRIRSWSRWLHIPTGPDVAITKDSNANSDFEEEYIRELLSGSGLPFSADPK